MAAVVAGAAGLLSPLRLGAVMMRNRVVMSPMTRGRATEGNVAGALQAEYYEQRASAGLIITEGTCVSQQGAGWWCAPGLFRDEQVAAWALTTERVHARGGLIACQLWHVGRATVKEVTGHTPVAPSAVPLSGEVMGRENIKRAPEVPHALSEAEIKLVVRDFAAAAANACKAGFDFVEVHAANGYLVDTFIQSSTNKRTDKYGGSVANRLRFLEEVVDAIVAEVGAARTAVRLNPNTPYNEMGSPDNHETFAAALRMLAPKKLAFLEVVDGVGFGFHNKDKLFTLDDARAALGAGCPTVLIGNCGYTPETAEAAVRAGKADAISFGRAFLGNPDLVERLANGVKLSEGIPYGLFYAGGAEGLVTPPRATAPGAAVGAKIPHGFLHEVAGPVSTEQLFKGRKVVVFGVPGAFTPGCDKTHLPGFVAAAADLKAKGVDEIVCLSVDNAWVMEAWGKSHGADGKVRMLGDPAAEYAKTLRLEFYHKGLGGACFKRFSAVVEDGTVTTLNVEDNNTGLSCSLATKLVLSANKGPSSPKGARPTSPKAAK
jgi:N-ethylmaleimide reductase